ncbi:MAG TPA: TIGR03617 family F420-dependent LLM class oxidoreductase [Acidimicrobiales bacterium]|jgi:probable F420-dependent oxidoreductase|nr:TIGR03617 family F420-dependent LLM class oxidoreductase [Acidimicrobiales bacterium]
MLVDTATGSIETAADDAATAEAAGYDGLFTGELNGDPFLPLVLAAGATRRLTVGTGIAVAFARSPMALAYTAHDLQRASGGRFVLGLGSQVKAHIERRFSMPWGRPAAQMREFVLALRAAWSSWSDGHPLDFEGEYYRHTLMPPRFVPVLHDFGPPPVYIAGVGDAMTRIAGEVADGFLCHAFTTERWIRQHSLPSLVEGRRRSGRSMDGFTVKAAIFLATGTDEEIEAEVGAIREQLAFYASTPAYRPILELHGWGDMGAELTRLSKAGHWNEMKHLITDEVVDTFAIVAPVKEVPHVLNRRLGDVVDRVSFLSSTHHPELVAACQGES